MKQMQSGNENGQAKHKEGYGQKTNYRSGVPFRNIQVFYQVGNNNGYHEG